MKKGMTKVSVLYPAGEGKTFDMDYYCNKHIPMVAGLLGDSVKGVTVEKGIGSGDPNIATPFYAVGNLYFNSVSDFEKSFGPNAEQIMGDTKNFANSEPVVLIGEVVI